jgi:hypothetical protein
MLDHVMKIIVPLSLVSLLGLSACANNPFSSYNSHSTTTLNRIYNGNLANAMEQESSADPLYNMEYGTLLRLNQDYGHSNYYYSLAQQSIDLWANSWLSTKSGALATQASSLLINDNANAYQPRGYERTFLTTFHALNHLDLHDLDNARVEIKRMYQIEQATANYNQALYHEEEQARSKIQTDPKQRYLSQQILQKYDFSDINRPQVLALKNSYQNAFSHYLAGFVFEALNEPSLARPGYVKAGQLNPYNPMIQQSIDNIDKNRRPKPGYSEVLIVEEVGHAPQVQSQELHIALNANFSSNNSCINTINIFFPRLVLDNRNQGVVPYQLDNAELTPDLMVDVNLMAARSLHDEIPHLIARNISAAIRNIATSQAACLSGGNLGTLLSLGTSLGGALLDHADERSWTLLPAQVYLNRMQLAYGKHHVVVSANGSLHTYDFTINSPYQILDFRILGNNVYFNSQLKESQP